MIAAALALVLVAGGAPSRGDLIWAYADARVSRQLDEWFKGGDFPRCVSLLATQWAYSPHDYDVVTNLGWLHESMREDDTALAFYAEYQKLNPDDPDNVLPVATLYNSRRKFDKVIEVLAPAVANAKASRKPHPNVYRLLGKSYERLNQPEEAIRIWRLQLVAYPGDLPAEANIRRVEAKMKSPSPGTPPPAGR